MTLQQLEYVVALDTHRHFVTAANHCFVTQPTITLQVKKLETELGIQIFDRDRSPLKPTKTGEVMIARAREIIREVKELKDLVKSEKLGIKGEFKVGIIPTISPYIVPRFIGDFSQSNPNTVLDINEMQTEAILEALELGNLDVGILVTPVNETFIREIPLYNEPFIFYGDSPKKTKKSPIAPDEIEKKEGLWLLNSGHCFRNQVLNICQPSEPNKNIRFQSGSIETLKHMVDIYGGFTLIPELALKMEEKSRSLNFTSPKPVREVSLVVHKSFPKEALIDALHKSILNIIPDSFEKNSSYIKINWK